MKASELRIGNIVKGPNIEFAISDGNTIDQSEKLKPIEITEQWLYKFGFAPIGDKYFYSYLKNGFKFHSQRPGNTKGFLWNTEQYYWDSPLYVKGGLKYVHHLQNLYHALTGEELVAR